MNWKRAKSSHGSVRKSTHLVLMLGWWTHLIHRVRSQIHHCRTSQRLNTNLPLSVSTIWEKKKMIKSKFWPIWRLLLLKLAPFFSTVLLGLITIITLFISFRTWSIRPLSPIWSRAASRKSCRVMPPCAGFSFNAFIMTSAINSSLLFSQKKGNVYILIVGLVIEARGALWICIGGWDWIVSRNLSRSLILTSWLSLMSLIWWLSAFFHYQFEWNLQWSLQVPMIYPK